MTDLADLIAEIRAAAAEWESVYGQPNYAANLALAVRAADALEAQPAPLIADSREALARALESQRSVQSTIDPQWEAVKITEELFASGVVSLAADRDRLVAERAWDQGNEAGWNDGAHAQVSSEFKITPNPYRRAESEGEHAPWCALLTTCAGSPTCTCNRTDESEAPVSSDEYVPAISELRDFCVEWGKVQHPHIDPRKTGEAFDRALAAHDAVVVREAKAEALREAATAIEHDEMYRDEHEGWTVDVVAGLAIELEKGESA